MDILFCSYLLDSLWRKQLATGLLERYLALLWDAGGCGIDNAAPLLC